MKKWHWFFIVLSFSIACKKDTTPVSTDFRDAWVGRYIGNVHQIYWTLNNTGNIDTIYPDTFFVSKPASADSIIVDGNTYPITAAGTYYITYSSPGNFIDLRLTADSCYLNQRSGGLGGYFQSIQSAKRQ